MNTVRSRSHAARLPQLARLRTSFVGLAVVAGGLSASVAAALRPETAVFPISTCGGCREQHPFVALQAGGGAVAWEDGGVFGGLLARRLDPMGSPVGSSVLLTFRDAVLGPLDIAPDGTPWVTFASAGALPNELSFSEVAEDRSAFVLRGNPDPPQLEPGGLVALGGPHVMASFEDLGSDGSSRQWVWRLGIPPAGQARQVSSTEGRARPRICPRPDGSFVVAWRTLSAGSYGVAYSLRGPNGDELRQAIALVSNLTDEPNHALACARDGRFAIAWESSVHPRAQGLDVVVQRFDRRARKVHRLDRAHAASAGDQRFAAIAFDPGGALLAAFQSIAGGRQQIFARRFAVNGAPEGAEVRVDAGAAELGEAGPGHPGVAPAGSSGRVLLVWSEGHTILGRKLRR